MADRTQASPVAQGVYAALATPRRPNSIEVDTAALLDYLDAIASAGVDGLVLFGSTGEFVHFGIDERVRAAALAIKRSRVPVLVNASHSTLAGAVTIAENAVDSGASGLLLAPPHFYRYGDNQLVEFYLQFNELVGQDSPVYLYNLPMFLSPISPELAARLLHTGAFTGIKDSSGESGYFSSLRALHPETSFQFLVGSESVYLQARSAGAEGAVSGVAAAIPELIIALDRAIKGGEQQVAQHLDKRLHEFLRYVDKFSASVAIRQAAVVRGWQLNHLAVPFDADTAAEVVDFHAWFRGWLAEVLPECIQPALMRT
ncbi:MAG: dihydrodipicolinate synthase family protein [Acidobacteriaceae bacterium]|nr:dihydrodipicolinate synthase family protein [Acidobacteriaceae bacterium]